MNKLNSKAWLGLIFLAVTMGLVLFATAGAIRYRQAWVYLGVYFGASALITLYLAKKDPALARRMRGGPTAEKQKTQKIIMLVASIGFAASLAVPGIDHRFKWSSVPLYSEITGDLLVMLGFYITFRAFRENTFTSSTIEISDGQRVISTGPYAIVRHPMYVGGLLLFILGGPLALGSYWGLLASAVLLPVLIWRLLDEEKFLVKNLPDYPEYRAKTRWRLIPGVF